jgi:hypothetical protein
MDCLGLLGRGLQAANFVELRKDEVRRNREIRSSTSENFYSTH